MISAHVKLAAKRQALETELSPELSPFIVNRGSIRRSSSSRRRRSHQTLSEERVDEVAEEKLDSVDEIAVQYRTQSRCLFML